jgi:hypothetical protein
MSEDFMRYCKILCTVMGFFLYLFSSSFSYFWGSEKNKRGRGKVHSWRLQEDSEWQMGCLGIRSIWM